MANVKPQVKLELSQEGFEDIHERVDKVRAGTKMVKLPIESVKALLRDHSAVLVEVEGV